jgi:hypothetical protein
MGVIEDAILGNTKFEGCGYLKLIYSSEDLKREMIT